MADTEKVVIIATHGPDDAERATLPFVMANAALALDMQAIVILQGTSVLLGMKATYGHVYAGGLAPLKDLVDGFLKGGGKLLVCTPCVQHRHIEQAMLVDGAELIAGARVILETTSASAVLCY
jgi:predicted peroxiredoxin